MADLRVSGLIVEYALGGHPVRPIDGLDMTAPGGALVLLLGAERIGQDDPALPPGWLLSPTRGDITFCEVNVSNAHEQRALTTPKCVLQPRRVDHLDDAAVFPCRSCSRCLHLVVSLGSRCGRPRFRRRGGPGAACVLRPSLLRFFGRPLVSHTQSGPTIRATCSLGAPSESRWRWAVGGSGPRRRTLDSSANSDPRTRHSAAWCPLTCSRRSTAPRAWLSQKSVTKASQWPQCDTATQDAVTWPDGLVRPPGHEREA